MAIHALYEVPAPAKINLFLHVVGRRDDGYHLLQSPFLLIDWCDLLHFERRQDGRLHRHDLGLALPAQDLSLRAAQTLQHASGCTLGADISVDKRVPWGAGLGGGSSDAASTLLALNRLWGLHWPRQRLQELALPLGADVPFFVGGQNAMVEGIGERLTPLPTTALHRRWLAVIKPAAAIPTQAIFTSPILARNTEAVIVIDSLEQAFSNNKAPPEWLASMATDGPDGGEHSGDGGDHSKPIAYFGRNDLQPPAEQYCNEVSDVAAFLLARFGNSRMSGSGSAVFARAGTGDQPMATWSAEELPPDWVGRMCRSLDHHPLRGWAD